MQNNTLSVWPICPLLETMYKSLSHIKLNEVWERKKNQQKNQKCKLILSPNPKEREKKKLEEGKSNEPCFVTYHMTMI